VIATRTATRQRFEPTRFPSNDADVIVPRLPEFAGQSMVVDRRKRLTHGQTASAHDGADRAQGRAARVGCKEIFSFSISHTSGSVKYLAGRAFVSSVMPGLTAVTRSVASFHRVMCDHVGNRDCKFLTCLMCGD
jgi:hypothetical protein